MQEVIEGEVLGGGTTNRGRPIYVVRLLAGNPGRIEVYTSHPAALAFIVDAFGGEEHVTVTCLTQYTWVNARRSGALLGFVLKQELHDHET